MDAYLDIETTGLSPQCDELTVVGISTDGIGLGELTQLVGDDITAERVLDAVQGVDFLYTYNGSRFDLPFIKARLGIDLGQGLQHRDLMYDCWARGLYGGLKVVERALGVRRTLPGLNGLEAVRLWYRYRAGGDESVLRRLLEYNREDVLNLKTLRTLLDA
jgi:uncharacterized protein YprB with RNaseH-like and TPR domain